MPSSLALFRGAINTVSAVTSAPFDPRITTPLLLALLYAPSSVLDDIRSKASISDAAFKRILTTLKYLVGLGLASKVNSFLSDRVLNNWASDVYAWDSREIVVVTGGSSGIGAALIDVLAQKDIKIAILDVSPPLKQYPLVSYHKCDVTSPESVAAAAKEIRVTHGGDPTVLVNNAGIGFLTPIVDATHESVKKIFDVNIIAHHTTCREFLPAMIAANHGHVISVASMASFVSAAGMVSYCSTKAAALAFHEGLAQELRHYHKTPKVRTSVVHPSWVQSPLIVPFQEALSKAPILKVEFVGKAIADHILAGRSGMVLLPKSMGGLLTSLRGLPHWLQEKMVRDSTKNVVASYKGDAAVKKGKDVKI